MFIFIHTLFFINSVKEFIKFLLCFYLFLFLFKQFNFLVGRHFIDWFLILIIPKDLVKQYESFLQSRSDFSQDLNFLLVLIILDFFCKIYEVLSCNFFKPSRLGSTHSWASCLRFLFYLLWLYYFLRLSFFISIVCSIFAFSFLLYRSYCTFSTSCYCLLSTFYLNLIRILLFLLSFLTLWSLWILMRHYFLTLSIIYLLFLRCNNIAFILKIYWSKASRKKLGLRSPW